MSNIYQYTLSCQLNDNELSGRLSVQTIVRPQLEYVETILYARLRAVGRDTTKTAPIHLTIGRVSLARENEAGGSWGQLGAGGPYSPC